MILMISYHEINVSFIYLIIMNAYLIFESFFRLKQLHKQFKSELFEAKKAKRDAENNEKLNKILIINATQIAMQMREDFKNEKKK